MALGFNDGRLAGERLLGLPGNRRPTAAFCANDLVALGLLQHLTQAGLRVPDDIAIVGYDDIEYASAAAVPLSSVAQPRYELGRAAAELLLDEADHGVDHEHRQLVFAPELIARASSGPDVLTPCARRAFPAARRGDRVPALDTEQRFLLCVD